MTVNSNARYVMAYRRRIKTALVYACGNECELCRHTYPQWVFEFHHIDPSLKSFSIANASTTRSKQACAREAKKCVMLCANCHREVEYSGQQFSFISRFNEDLFFNKMDELNGVAKRKRKQVYKEQKRMLSEQRKSAKPSRAELKQLLRSNTMTSIGALYGVSDNAVRKWARKYSLPSKMSDIKQYSDKEWEAV